MDDTKCFNALKKCNEVGKKLNDSSYILYDGMIFADKVVDGAIAPCYSISIISDKIINDLDAINYIGLKIEPSELSSLYKDYDFDRFEMNGSYLKIVFKGLYLSDEDINNDFTKFAIEKFGKTQEYIENMISRDFDTDIDLYESYIKFKKGYDNKGHYREFSYNAKIIHDNTKLLNKMNKIIDRINNGYMFAYREFDDDVYEKIINAEKPIDIRFEDDNGNIFKMRIMKSLFKTCVKSSNTSIRIIKINDKGEFYVLVYVNNKSFNNICIYKALNY